LNSPKFSSNKNDVNSNSYSSNNLNTYHNSHSRSNQAKSEEPLLGRKKSRKKPNEESDLEKAEPIGVKLVCESPNDDLKKYFNKTVLYFKIRNFTPTRTLLLIIFLNIFASKKIMKI
jgi:hypothetical protein